MCVRMYIHSSDGCCVCVCVCAMLVYVCACVCAHVCASVCVCVVNLRLQISHTPVLTHMYTSPYIVRQYSERKVKAACI